MGVPLGSPPRMRGKPGSGTGRRAVKRITPARAGKTAFSEKLLLSSSDHPRACGENASDVIAMGVPLGSPPRMRGKPGSGTGRRAVKRITPARAGKTLNFRLRLVISSDHPRACGENYTAYTPEGKAYGSPPRVRGKHGGEFERSNITRITPARAGKTIFKRGIHLLYADHPRACGENCVFRSARLFPTGSPPRVRGKLCSVLCDIYLTRITPARAGKTFVFLFCHFTYPDHPRACGENAYNSLSGLY